ncbi:SRPBCC family protein [Microbacter sp. GSS18]|nr:SRPBCC family protein [Microbacter sp. GSS18]
MGAGRASEHRHVRSILVSAPVAEVFDHISEPRNFVAADPANVELTNVEMKAEGSGSTWETSFRVAGMPVHARWTRREFQRNNRIVDHASTGMSWTFETAAEGPATRLTVSFAPETRSGVINAILDRTATSEEPQLEAMVEAYRDAIESA